MSRSMRRMRRARLAALTGAVAMLMALLPATAASAAPSQTACDNRDNNTYSKLLECVRLTEVREHQAALQDIADDNGGTRAAGTPGYDASVDYVVDTLESAGWDVALHEFPFLFIPPPTLQQLTPAAATYETGAFTGSGFGDVSASVVPVDINLAPPQATSSGCDGAFAEAAVGAPLVADPGGPDDFAGFPAGGIALIQRGTCCVRDEGLQRPDGGCQCGHHLQPGQHAGALRLDRGQCHGAAAGSGAAVDPCRRRVVRRRVGVGAGRLDRPASTSTRPRAVRRST